MMISIRLVWQGQGMSMRILRPTESTIMQASKKNPQSSKLPRMPKTSEISLGYLANTRVSGNEGRDSKEGYLSTGIYPW